MKPEHLFEKSKVVSLIGSEKKYGDKAKIKAIAFSDIQTLLTKKPNNVNFDVADLTVEDDESNEYVVVIQLGKDEDIDDFSASLFLKIDKEQVFLCRLDYHSVHLRKCRRESFEESHASKFHFHVHCKECYEQMGKNGIWNIAFSVKNKSNITLSEFLSFFFQKINVQTDQYFRKEQLSLEIINDED